MSLVLAVLLAANSVVISGPLTMAASTEKKILVVRIGATEVRHYDVAVGTKAHPTPMGRFVAWASAGCAPDEMGIVPETSPAADFSRRENFTITPELLTFKKR